MVFMRYEFWFVHTHYARIQSFSVFITSNSVAPEVSMPRRHFHKENGLNLSFQGTTTTIIS